jgi:AN1-type zinc finger protein 5/6
MVNPIKSLKDIPFDNEINTENKDTLSIVTKQNKTHNSSNRDPLEHKKIKISRDICSFCGNYKKNKKTLLLYDCNCNNKFCSLHLMPEIHNCTYNYKEQYKKKLKTENPKVHHIKINKL